MMDVRCGKLASERKPERQVTLATKPSVMRFRPRNIMAATTAVCALTALSSCSPVPDLPPAPAQPPPATGYVSSLEPYRIQVGDVLEIRLMLNPELNEEVAVRPDGYISTTVARNELAYGRTVPELTAALTRAYSADLRNPRISVILRSFAPTRIYVGGEVNNPGEFIDVGPTLTLSQAMARAGGLKFTTSDESKIFIIRRGPNDVPEFFSTRFNAIMWGKDPTADVRLAPYDVVFVPRTTVAEVYRFFETYLLQFVPVSWGFSYVVGNGGGGGNNVVPVASGAAAVR